MCREMARERWTGHPAGITEYILQIQEKLSWEWRIIFLVKATGIDEIRKTENGKSWALNPREPWLLKAYYRTRGRTDLRKTGAEVHEEQISRRVNWSTESNAAQKTGKTHRAPRGPQLGCHQWPWWELSEPCPSAEATSGKDDRWRKSKAPWDFCWLI